MAGGGAIVIPDRLQVDIFLDSNRNTGFCRGLLASSSDFLMYDSI